MDAIVVILGSTHHLAIGNRDLPGEVLDRQIIFFQEIDGQRLQRIGIGDRIHLQERCNGADLSAAFEFRGGRRDLARDLAGVFVDDERRLQLDLAIAQRVFAVGIDIEIERVIVHRLGSRPQPADREWRQNTQLLDRQRSALSFKPRPRGSCRSRPGPGCRDPSGCANRRRPRCRRSVRSPPHELPHV
jgi:hypothetical protein